MRPRSEVLGGHEFGWLFQCLFVSPSLTLHPQDAPGSCHFLALGQSSGLMAWEEWSFIQFSSPLPGSLVFSISACSYCPHLGPPSLSFCALGGLFSHRLLAMAGNRGPSSLFLPPTLPRYILPFISCKVIPLGIYTQYTSSSYQHVRSVSNL